MSFLICHLSDCFISKKESKGVKQKLSQISISSNLQSPPYKILFSYNFAKQLDQYQFFCLANERIERCF